VNKSPNISFIENAAKIQQGRIISIRNGRSEVFKERMRLEVDRWGKIQEEKVQILAFFTYSNEFL